MAPLRFGLQPVPRVLGEGTFHCPNCRAMASYEHVETRRWIALGVPLVPLQRLGEWLQCGGCESTFGLSVLDRPVEDGGGTFQAAVLQAMIGMMTVDGWIDDAEIQVLRDIYLRVVREELDEAAVREVVARADARAEPLEEALRQMAPELNAAERELVVQAAFRVAMADGTFAQEEKRLLRTVAACFDYDERWFRNFLTATNPMVVDRR